MNKFLINLITHLSKKCKAYKQQNIRLQQKLDQKDQQLNDLLNQIDLKRCYNYSKGIIT